MWQCLCVACVLWLFPAERPPQRTRDSNYATIRVLTMQSIRYRPIALPPVSAHELGGTTGERTARLTVLLRPSSPRTTTAHALIKAESWAALVIGNPELNFAAPLTLSLDQPSRPVELRVGDFGMATSLPGASHTGHGGHDGFVKAGFGNGYGGGQEQIDREPVRIISKPTPVYTEEARNNKIEGDVVIDLIFTADCRVIVVRILRTLGHGLDETAVQAVSEIVFHPATENGRVVNFQARARVKFRLVESVVEGDQL
jgi:TonB family protein